MDELTPQELAEVTGKKRPAAQAAELARRGIAYGFTGSRVRVQRAVALAYELLPQSHPGDHLGASTLRWATLPAM